MAISPVESDSYDEIPDFPPPEKPKLLWIALTALTCLGAGGVALRKKKRVIQPLSPEALPIVVEEPAVQDPPEKPEIPPIGVGIPPPKPPSLPLKPPKQSVRRLFAIPEVTYPLLATPQNREDVAYIIESLSQGVVHLLCNKQQIEGAGDQIKNLHPLKFLEIIFSDSNLSQHISTTQKNFIKRPWREFISNLQNNMVREKEQKNLSRYIKPFAKSLKLSVEEITPWIENPEDSEKLVLYLIEKTSERKEQTSQVSPPSPHAPSVNRPHSPPPSRGCPPKVPPRKALGSLPSLPLNGSKHPPN